jgi:hypothetical protein
MKSKQQTCLLLLNYFLYVCVYEGLVVESSKRRLAPQNSLQKKRREIFFTKRGDRLIEKIAKKQGKKNKRFSFAETDALLTEKKNNILFALERIIVPHF